MELRHFRCFVALAEHLHFAHAAELLHVTQPGLSQQIKALEDELGVRLFDRRKREVFLTEAGSYFLQEAQLTLKHAERAQAIAKRVARGQLGSLRIGYVSSVPFTGILSQIAAEFRQHAPGLELLLEEMFGPEQLIKIAAGTLDAGIIRLPVEHELPHLETKVLIKERMVVAVKEDNPVARLEEIPVADLRNESFIVWKGIQPNTLNGHLVALAQKGNFALRLGQAAPTPAAMIALVAGGAGVAFVPESLENMNLPSVCFRPLADLERISEVAVCYRSDETSLAVWKFLKMLNAFEPQALTGMGTKAREPVKEAAHNSAEARKRSASRATPAAPP
jgi:DNA-binding transcriptional LysR family regulator